MGKKKSSNALAAQKICVKAGIVSPEFPDVSLAGWTGQVVETQGKPPTQQLIIEWDEATLAAMPDDYVRRCEDQQLYYRMACLKADDVEAA